jgi:Zn-dependent M28 family amino/carboxypeptidase
MHEANALNTAGLIEITDGKLTMGVSLEQVPFTHFVVRESAIPSGAKAMETVVNANYRKLYKTQNIIGTVSGEITDTFIVVSAHYDHLGMLGASVYFPGANDNASGVSMMLELAKHYAKPENKPRYSMLFIAFSAEEAGIAGSRYFTENPLINLSQIRFLLNMDILGTGDDGIKVVNGTVHTEEFDRLSALNTSNQYLKTVQSRGKAANSDHHFFSEKGVSAFFIYTLGGIDAYHDIYDKAETLPLTEFDDLFLLLTGFIEGF